MALLVERYTGDRRAHFILLVVRNAHFSLLNNLKDLTCGHVRKFVTLSIIQLMHSFEVNIRICQPENSDVHRGEAEVNITFEG